MKSQRSGARRWLGLGLLLCLFNAHPTSAQAPTTRPDRATVVRDKVSPRWISDTQFWYRNDLADGRREYVLIDAEKGTRAPLFDAGKLAAALSAAAGRSFDPGRLSIDTLSVDSSAAGAVAWTMTLDGIAFRVDPTTLRILSHEPTTQPTSTQPTTRRRRGRDNREANWWDRLTSPDGKWKAAIEAHNIVLTDAQGEKKTFSTDGTEAFAYDRVFWSPDSSAIVAFRVERGDHKPVYRLESSPRNGAKGGGVGRSILHTDEYTLPGDKFDSFELSLFDVASGQLKRPELERIDASDWGGHPSPTIRWRPDGKRFLYEKHDRGHQRLRLIEVDATTGATRTVLDEQSKTFIWTAHVENINLQVLNYLSNRDEVLYISEQSGWRHVYLLDLESAQLKPITQGDWVLRGIERIDEAAREIWFAASGVYPGQDPYLVHYGRVKFDGTGLVWLTQANGTHALNFAADSTAFSPKRDYVVVTHSRVDSPPVTELRKTSDGALLATLERAEVSADWNPPEVFVAKGRDDQTDIWGIICRPADFDPTKKYPIIEDVYAGPQSAYVPKSFSAASRYDFLTRLGFIVVKVDGMGTALRSKAFHDVCWQNLGDAGFPDRIKWIREAAKKDPAMDTDRVGIFGTSAGGQSAAGALIFHSDFYKVAVSNCGCHDNRMDKSSWNEQWMGYPIGPHYSASSNIDNAAKLKGRLQLVLGELDDNVPVDSTYRLVDALVQAGKEFEFVLIPGAGHGAGSPITRRKMQDFFVKHLQGIDPPNPN